MLVIFFCYLFLSNVALYAGTTHSCLRKEKTGQINQTSDFNRIPPEILYTIVWYMRINDMKEYFHKKELLIKDTEKFTQWKKNLIFIAQDYKKLDFAVNRSQWIVAAKYKSDIYEFFVKNRANSKGNRISVIGDIPIFIFDTDWLHYYYSYQKYKVPMFTISQNGRTIYSIEGKDAPTDKQEIEEEKKEKIIPSGYALVVREKVDKKGWLKIQAIPFLSEEVNRVKGMQVFEEFNSLVLLYDNDSYDVYRKTKAERNFIQTVNDYFAKKSICKSLIPVKK